MSLVRVWVGSGMESCCGNNSLFLRYNVYKISHFNMNSSVAFWTFRLLCSRALFQEFPSLREALSPPAVTPSPSLAPTDPLSPTMASPVLDVSQKWSPMPSALGAWLLTGMASRHILAPSTGLQLTASGEMEAQCGLLAEAGHWGHGSYLLWHPAP